MAGAQHGLRQLRGGDGDLDDALVNDGGSDNRLWINVLGIPDNHAPQQIGGCASF